MKRGFTIVELLIVVVVISILAAVTIVAYGGVQKRAVVSGMQSTLGQMVRKIEISKTNNNDSYSASLPADIPDSVRGNDKTPLRYFQRNSGSGFCADTYSVQYTDVRFYVDSDHLTPQSGLCPEGPAVTSFSSDYTVFVYNLNAPNCNGSTIQLPISTPTTAPGSTIDWGDGVTASLASSLPSHTYAQKSEYTVAYKGPISTIDGALVPMDKRACLTQVKQWSGAVSLTQISYLGGENLIYVAEPPHTVTDMNHMFAYATTFNQTIGGWNMSNVTNTSAMFYSAASFNQPIGSWDMSNVTNMNNMFNSATTFNQPIGTWDTNQVTDISYMFISATAFNQPIGSWNTASVTNMNNTFYGATAFNQPLNSWNTSNVTNMEGMFQQATKFNQPIGSWNTSKVTNMISMFFGASSFNQPIGSWNTAHVTNTSFMFYSAAAFNQNITAWNVGAVTGWMYFKLYSPLTDTNTPPKFI